MAVRVGETTLALGDDDGQADATARACLFLVLECHRPLSGGARYDLEGIDEVVLGRGSARLVQRDASARRLVLQVPDPAMSSRHASLVRSAAGFELIDHGSTNGSRVNGSGRSRAQVGDGDVLEFGGTFMLVRTHLASADAPGDADAAQLAQAQDGLSTLVPGDAALLARLRQVAASDVPVLLQGESGTGKERLAAALHRESGRRGALVPVNCGALPESLVESQLFGHVRGAFSGAVRDEVGLVRAAAGGTLFLDEIGDMPKASQAALLRVLQEREVTPVGSTQRVKVDFRVVSATHRLLRAQAGALRPDLYARLAGYTHVLPALRERREDLGLLLAAVLPEVAPRHTERITLKAELGRALLRHHWPLNIRELAQAFKVASVVARAAPLSLEHFAHAFDAPTSGHADARTSPPLDAAEPNEPLRATLVAALQLHQGNITRVARELGKTRMQIHRWLRRFAIDPATYRR